MIMDMFAKVTEFNREVIGYERPDKVVMLPLDVRELSLIQLREEVDELENATTATDQIDALHDLVYFAFGALYKMGVTEELHLGIVDAIHSYNMRKKAGKKEGRGYEGTAVDAIKPGAEVPRPEVAIKKLIGE